MSYYITAMKDERQRKNSSDAVQLHVFSSLRLFSSGTIFILPNWSALLFVSQVRHLVANLQSNFFFLISPPPLSILCFSVTVGHFTSEPVRRGWAVQEPQRLLHAGQEVAGMGCLQFNLGLWLGDLHSGTASFSTVASLAPLASVWLLLSEPQSFQVQTGRVGDVARRFRRNSRLCVARNKDFWRGAFV